MADPSANIIFGAVVDDRYHGEIHVTLIATGFSRPFQKEKGSASVSAVEEAVGRLGGGNKKPALNNLIEAPLPLRSSKQQFKPKERFFF